MSLREDRLFVFRLQQCLLMCDWAQVSRGERKQVGRRAARGRVRKDESNALQQRTVTDGAFILAETAPVAGRPRRQRWDRLCSQATAAGEEGEEKEVKTRGSTSHLLLCRQRRSLGYYFGFSSSSWQQITSFFFSLSFLIVLCLKLKEVLAAR